jgi:hypothetical protein
MLLSRTLLAHLLSITNRLVFCLEKTPNNFNHFVKDNYILQEEFGAGVHIAVIECYIIHSIITDQFTIEMKNDILLLIGSLTLNLTEIQDLKLREAREGPSALLSLQIEGKRGEI